MFFLVHSINFLINIIPIFLKTPEERPFSNEKKQAETIREINDIRNEENRLTAKKLEKERELLDLRKESFERESGGKVISYKPSKEQMIFAMEHN